MSIYVRRQCFFEIFLDLLGLQMALRGLRAYVSIYSLFIFSLFYISLH